MTTQKGVITRPLRAFIALILTASVAAQSLYSTLTSKHSFKDLITGGFHPHWHFVAATVAFQLLAALSLLVFAFNPLRKEGRVFWLAIASAQSCFPATLLFPKAERLLQPVHVGSLLIAFLAAGMLFKSLCEEQGDKKLH
jgi:hypothetical protein